jgi:hypothetical protein
LELVIRINNARDRNDIREATHSPLGEDGYPQRIWDKYTGDIDKEAAIGKKTTIYAIS